MVNDNYSSENTVTFFQILRETGRDWKSWGWCFFFSFSRKANVAVMNFAFDMGKLIRETLYVLQIAI